MVPAACGTKPEVSGTRTFLNRLAEANSPYLREHADNPVDWYEWGPEALDKASKENKPLIISIGYSSCHWCHVMEEESFMDTAVARLMNAHFISVKIDREERPDIDQIYVRAAELLSGQAGWPLNAFALPDGKPFYAATYFPKTQWIALLHQVRTAFGDEKSNVIRQAESLTAGIEMRDQFKFIAGSGITTDRSTYSDICEEWSVGLDRTHGGLQGEQKFPMPSVWEFGLQYYFLTGNNKALELVTTTLDHMANGGIYDHVGGGFSRYATDRAWRIPHFEKMLYDNAQLVSLYTHAWQLTKDPRYAQVVKETLAFVKREMTRPSGGFYSSLNADSEGEEGRYYTWTKSEIREILDPEAVDLFCDYYHVVDSGNWENGRNILYTNGPFQSVTSGEKLTEDRRSRIIADARKKLLAAREARIRPSTDDKILTSWNALMIRAYLDAFAAMGDEAYLKTALANAHFLDKEMIRQGGALWRSYNEGQRIEGFLEDYALLARAFISLYEITFDIHWLQRARALADFSVDHFYDPESGMFYYTSDLSERLVVRTMEVADGVMPSSNSAIAEVLLLLGTYFQEDAYTARANRMLSQILAGRLTTSPHFYAYWGQVVAMLAYEPFEIAVMGSRARETSLKMQERYHPLAMYTGGERETLPLLKNKYVEGKTIIYVCRNRVCQLPVEDVSQALAQLKIRE